MAKIEILYIDDDLIAVNKPCGISVTKDRSGQDDLLPIITSQLKLTADQELRLIHRLDKLTSGVMIIARNKQTQSIYSSLMEKRQIQKTYLAITSGYVHKDSGTVKTPLSADRRNPGRMKINPRLGKPALTEWNLLADFGSYSLIAAKPITGRTHQIRLHMKTIGLPLAIDPLYGGTKPIMLSDIKNKYRTGKFKEEKPLIDRLTLHAYQIELPATETKPALRFVAKLDNQFAAAVKMLAKHNPGGLESFLNPEDFEAITTGQWLESRE